MGHETGNIDTVDKAFLSKVVTLNNIEKKNPEKFLAFKSIVYILQKENRAA